MFYPQYRPSKDAALNTMDPHYIFIENIFINNWQLKLGVLSSLNCYINLKHGLEYIMDEFKSILNSWGNFVGMSPQDDEFFLNICSLFLKRLFPDRNYDYQSFLNSTQTSKKRTLSDTLQIYSHFRSRELRMGAEVARCPNSHASTL